MLGFVPMIFAPRKR